MTRSVTPSAPSHHRSASPRRHRAASPGPSRPVTVPPSSAVIWRDVEGGPTEREGGVPRSRRLTRHGNALMSLLTASAARAVTGAARRSARGCQVRRTAPHRRRLQLRCRGGRRYHSGASLSRQTAGKLLAAMWRDVRTGEKCREVRSGYGQRQGLSAVFLRLSLLRRGAENYRTTTASPHHRSSEHLSHHLTTAAGGADC